MPHREGYLPCVKAPDLEMAVFTVGDTKEGMFHFYCWLHEVIMAKNLADALT
jgi:hypothetical protein